MKKNKFTSQVFADDHEVMSSVCCSHEAAAPSVCSSRCRTFHQQGNQECYSLLLTNQVRGQQVTSPHQLIDSALLPYHGSSSGGGVCVQQIALSPGIRTSRFPQSHHKRRKTIEKAPRYRNIVLAPLRTSMGRRYLCRKIRKMWSVYRKRHRKIGEIR